MQIEQEITIEAPIDKTWAYMTDLARISRCVPDVESIEVVDGDTAVGTMKVRVGPIGLRLQGRVRFMTRDPDNKVAVLEIQATDNRIGGGVTAQTTFRLTPAGTTTTNLSVTTEATLLGRLGQFGQPIVRRKSDEIAKQFARNVAVAVAESGAGPT